MKLRSQMQLAGLFISLLATISPALASTWTLDKVVSLTRHGVRPQTNTEKLNKATQLEWPKFDVADGNLTGHGYAGMMQQGTYLLAQWQQQGLNVKSQCPNQEQFFLWTSPSPRIKATGKAMADGMFPGCGITPLSVNAENGPLFELYDLGEAHPDKAIMTKQIMERMGSPEQAAAHYKESVDLLRKTVCATDKPSCAFLDKPWGVKFKASGKPKLKGPGEFGATIGETIRLQYSDNMPIRDVAFGHGVDAKAVKALMAMHAAQYHLALDTPEFAAHSGSLLMRQMLSAVTAGTNLASQWPGDERLTRPLVMLLGHDTNIAEIQTLLGFDWELPDYPANDIPPGGTLSFARFHKAGSDKEFVRVRFEARTLDQWRSLSPLSKKQPLPYQDMNVEGCQSTEVGVLCPLDTIVKRASKLLVNDGMQLAAFQTN